MRATPASALWVASNAQHGRDCGGLASIIDDAPPCGTRYRAKPYSSLLKDSPVSTSLLKLFSTRVSNSASVLKESSIFVPRRLRIRSWFRRVTAAVLVIAAFDIGAISQAPGANGRTQCESACRMHKLHLRFPLPPHAMKPMRAHG